MRIPVIAGNWKMYKTAGEAVVFLHHLAPKVANATHAEVVVCAPFVDIAAAVEAIALVLSGRYRMDGRRVLPS